MKTLAIIVAIYAAGIAWDRIVEPLMLDECERALAQRKRCNR